MEKKIEGGTIVGYMAETPKIADIKQDNVVNDILVNEQPKVQKTTKKTTKKSN